MDRLKEKVALITGGAGGIGLAAARLFAAERAKVVIADLQDATLQAALREIGHSDVTTLITDITDDTQMRDAIASVIDRHGRLESRDRDPTRRGGASPGRCPERRP